MITFVWTSRQILQKTMSTNRDHWNVSNRRKGMMQWPFFFTPEWLYFFKILNLYYRDFTTSTQSEVQWTLISELAVWSQLNVLLNLSDICALKDSSSGGCLEGLGLQCLSESIICDMNGCFTWSSSCLLRATSQHVCIPKKCWDVSPQKNSLLITFSLQHSV